jgi:hypothetical protein
MTRTPRKTAGAAIAMAAANIAAALALTVSTTSLLAQNAPPAGDDAAAAAELAKKLSNPIASLISFPLQANFDYGQGDGSGYKFVLNVQPVVPISLNEKWNVISRTILPLAYQSHVADSGNQGGLGDILESLFFSPKAPTKGGVIWGIGPAILVPSATDSSLGGKKWAAGPTFVALRQDSGWTYGVLANQLWSFAGSSDRSEINALFVQPFVSKTTKTLTTFTLNTETTYNWKAASDHWSVPVNLSVSQLMKFGKMPVSLTGGLRYWADSPAGGPSGFGYRFAVTLLFPK